MATLTIRNLPDEVRDGLRVRAAQNGRSMEAEARAVLSEAIGAKPRMSKEEYRAVIAEIQAEMRQFVRPGRSLVDELIAERRWEAACEDAEMKGLPKPPLSDFVKDE
jgi:plasmid stability protein